MYLVGHWATHIYPEAVGLSYLLPLFHSSFSARSSSPTVARMTDGGGAHGNGGARCRDPGAWLLTPTVY